MKVVICIKQVPDTADIKWTANNTIVREGGIINPFDLYAIETALKIKDKLDNVEITAVTMGPNQAVDILKSAIAMGVDKAFLLSDKRFSGADTVATARTLAAGIKKMVPDFDLILCGQLATDGDTAQTGPSIAQNLDIPQVTYVKDITEIKNKTIIVQKEVEDGIEILQGSMPMLLCVQKCDYEPRRPKINGFINAHNSKIDVVTLDDIDLEAQDVGIKGSPTYVSKAFRPAEKISGEIFTPKTKTQAAELIIAKLKEFGVKL